MDQGGSSGSGEKWSFLNIFVRKSQQDLLMHTSNVCDRKNSTITPKLSSNKGGVAKTELAKGVGENLHWG